MASRKKAMDNSFERRDKEERSTDKTTMTEDEAPKTKEFNKDVSTSTDSLFDTLINSNQKADYQNRIFHKLLKQRKRAEQEIELGANDSRTCSSSETFSMSPDNDSLVFSSGSNSDAENGDDCSDNIIREKNQRNLDENDQSNVPEKKNNDAEKNNCNLTDQVREESNQTKSSKTKDTPRKICFEDVFRSAFNVNNIYLLDRIFDEAGEETDMLISRVFGYKTDFMNLCECPDEELEKIFEKAFGCDITPLKQLGKPGSDVENSDGPTKKRNEKSPQESHEKVVGDDADVANLLEKYLKELSKLKSYEARLNVNFEGELNTASVRTDIPEKQHPDNASKASTTFLYNSLLDSVNVVKIPDEEQKQLHSEVDNLESEIKNLAVQLNDCIEEIQALNVLKLNKFNISKEGDPQSSKSLDSEYANENISIGDSRDVQYSLDYTSFSEEFYQYME